MIWALRLLIAVALSWIAYKQTDNFSLSMIEGPLPLEKSEGGVPSIDRVLMQPYRYLGKGRQSFVFESEDGKWVLKFFNQKYFRTPWYAEFDWPFFSQQRMREVSKRSQRREFYLNSYSIAARELKEETGIVYLHLAPEKFDLPKVQITDKAGRKFEIDLNKISFVLQKKGVPLYSAFDAAFAQGGEMGLYRFLDLFLDSVALRIAKKIGDADHDVEHNWAVSEGKVFHLDPGRFYIDENLLEPPNLKHEWWRATHCLIKWLALHYPGADLYLKRKIEANICETTTRLNSTRSAAFRALRRDGMLRERFQAASRIAALGARLDLTRSLLHQGFLR